MRRFTLLELSGMELDEVAHVRRCFFGELVQCVRHAIVTPLLSASFGRAGTPSGLAVRTAAPPEAPTSP
jgi:hypothetical protein